MSDDFTGVILGNKYEIEAVLGSGGMGLVFLAQDHTLRRHVAIKIIRPEYAHKARVAGAFVHEAQTLAYLEHPYILRVYDFGIEPWNDQKLFYLVMSYAPGGTLTDRLALAPATLDETLQILQQVCEALDYAHAHNVIHLDLKPLNILFDRQGNIQVADFGIAQLLANTDRIKVDTGLGTRNYMPPEQMIGGEVGPFSDIYAIGLLLHELLTGDLPPRRFDRGTVTLTIDAAIPAPIRAIIARATQNDPDLRYSSAGDLFNDLLSSLNTPRQPVPAQRHTPQAVRHDEARRMDAAMPSRTAVDQPTEVWVQICLPGSPGFRDDLPQITKAGDVITQQDVQAGKLTVSFPIDPQTGRPSPIRIAVEVKAPDFALDEPRQEILLLSSKDSAKLLFSLRPIHARKRSLVHVTARQYLSDGSIVTVGAAALTTSIAPTGVRLAAHLAWSMISFPLAAIMVRQQVPQEGTTDLGRVPETVNLREPSSIGTPTDDVVTEASNILAASSAEHTTLDVSTGQRPASRRFWSQGQRLAGGALALAALILVGLLASSLSTSRNEQDNSGMFGAAASEPRSDSADVALAETEIANLPGRTGWTEIRVMPDCTTSAAFSPTSARLACLDATNTLRVWDLNTFTQLSSLVLPYPAQQVAFRSENEPLVLSQDENGLRLWNPQTGTTIFELGIQVGHATVAGTRLAVYDTGSEQMRQWDYLTGVEFPPIKTSDVRALALGPEDTTLAVVNETGVQLWQADQTSPLTIHVQVDHVALTSQGSMVATGQSDGVIRWWDGHTGELMAETPTGIAMSTMALSPDGSLLSITGRDGSHLWSVDLNR
jgi:WD40 repeat protein